VPAGEVIQVRAAIASVEEVFESQVKVEKEWEEVIGVIPEEISVRELQVIDSVAQGSFPGEKCWMGRPTGEVSLGNDAYYLQFPNGNIFGYYNYTFFPFLYHYDLGFEYFFDDGKGDAYMFDFASGHWLYTSQTYSFPNMVDLTLINPSVTNCPNAAAQGGCPGVPIYYFPDTKHPGRYTTNPRYFLNYVTGVIFTM
jgi:hypothetical protein